MGIDEMVMHQLFQLTRIISRSLNNNFNSYNLHFSEWGIILTLQEHGLMTQQELADYLQIEPSAVSRSLVGLQKKGYIVRERGIDRREKIVSLTDLAKEQYQVWDSIAAKHRKSLLVHFSEGRKNELYRVLNTIFETAQKLESHMIKGS